VRRREFIVLLGGAAITSPLAATAQQPERVHSIGVLMGLAGSDPEGEPRKVALQETLRRLGWTDGRNIRIDYLWAGGDVDRTRESAAELVRLAPDVIIATSTGVDWAASTPSLSRSP
jgi:putative tryptophan/tyrosine transport system substrate-binding protein